MQLKYRPEIDGLRAFAVISVVLYHFFPNFLVGGFVGVDIFFVISGFLVTSILVRENENKDFKFSLFYGRRIRRLLPSLITLLAACLPLGAMLLLSEEFQSLGLHTAFASVFSSNFLLINEIGYFDSATVYKPLLHLWSLAVEEQFYFVWPFIIWLIFKVKQSRLIWVLGFLTVLSFVLNIFYIKLDQTPVFYLLGTRLWELGAGGILGLTLLKNSSKENPLRQNVFSVTGCIGLLYSVFFIHYNVDFPGYLAALPALSTCLIIYGGPQTFTGRILSTPLLVYVGLFSFPLYLWHWPLYSFANIALSQEVSLLLKLLLILISVVFSILTFEFIEKPLRTRKIATKLVLPLALSLFALGLLGIVIWNQKGFPSRYPKIESIAQSRLTFKPGAAEPQNKKCRQTFYDTEYCYAADLDKKATVAVIGDSHAGPTFWGVKNYYINRGDNPVLLMDLAVPPLADVFVLQNGTEKHLNGILDYVANSDSIQTVVLSAFWAAYFEKSEMHSLAIDHKYKIFDKNNSAEKDQNKIFETGLKRTLDKLIQKRKKVVLVFNLALIPFNVKRCYKRPLIENKFNCSVSPEYVKNTYSLYRESINRIVASYDKNSVKTFDPLEKLCDEKTCPMMRDEKLIYNDTNHATLNGSLYLFSHYQD